MAKSKENSKNDIIFRIIKDNSTREHRNLTKIEKRKLINRISAKKSRDNVKKRMFLLENENFLLKDVNSKLNHLLNSQKCVKCGGDLRKDNTNNSKSGIISNVSDNFSTFYSKTMKSIQEINEDYELRRLKDESHFWTDETFKRSLTNQDLVSDYENEFLYKSHMEYVDNENITNIDNISISSRSNIFNNINENENENYPSAFRKVNLAFGIILSILIVLSILGSNTSNMASTLIPNDDIEKTFTKQRILIENNNKTSQNNLPVLSKGKEMVKFTTKPNWKPSKQSDMENLNDILKNNILKYLMNKESTSFLSNEYNSKSLLVENRNNQCFLSYLKEIIQKEQNSLLMKSKHDSKVIGKNIYKNMGFILINKENEVVHSKIPIEFENYIESYTENLNDKCFYINIILPLKLVNSQKNILLDDVEDLNNVDDNNYIQIGCKIVYSKRINKGYSED